MLSENDLDALLCFSQESDYYLTGYDTSGYVFFQCLILTADSQPITLLTRRPDLEQAHHTSIIEDVRVWYDTEESDPTEDLQAILEEKGLKGARIGVELNSYGLTGFNLTDSTATAGAMTGVFNSIDYTVPPNAGSFRRVRIHLREGCIVGIPNHPYSCSMGTSNICDRLENAVVHAIAELDDGFGMAECGPLLPPASGVISGVDPRTGESYVNEIFLFHTGAGASPTADGWLTLTGMESAGLCLLDSVEIDELRFPIRVYQQGLAMDTEGVGRRRGAPGAHVEFGPVGCSMSVAYASDGSTYPAVGVRGGGTAARAQQIRRDTAGNEHDLDACDEVALESGEVMISITQPGGGYGLPMEREPERVHKDVVEGWISTTRARDVYGVAINAEGGLDAAATRTLREQLKTQ